MSLPLFRPRAGEPVRLTWTRLLAADEVQAKVPDPPPRELQPSLVLESAAPKAEGDGFDRRALLRRKVISHDGAYVIGDRTVKGRPLPIGMEIVDEPGRAWGWRDLPAAKAAARTILEAHAFPVHLAWPAGVWAWSDGELYWSVAPESGGALVREGGGAEDADMTGVTRGDLGWPDVGQRPDPRALSSWPRFSAFGWALSVFDALADRPRSPELAQRAMFELGGYLAEQRLHEAYHHRLEGFDITRRKGGNAANEKKRAEWKKSLRLALARPAPAAGWTPKDLALNALSAVGDKETRDPRAFERYIKDLRSAGDPLLCGVHWKPDA